MNIWMLIIEENKEITEFSSVVSPYHECVVYITKFLVLWMFFWGPLSQNAPWKCWRLGEIGKPIAIPEVCS